MRNNLRFRITAIFIALAIGPLVIAGVLLAERSFAAERAQASELEGQIAQRVAAEVDTFFQEFQNEIEFLSRDMQSNAQLDVAQIIACC